MEKVKVTPIKTNSENIKSILIGEKIIRKVDLKSKFISSFNLETGFYVRSGVLEEKEGKKIDTNIDPFMASYPELIDVGIMGHCDHGIKGLCRLAGVQCYQNGLGQIEPNMLLQDYMRIVDESKGKLFQIALGGRGDPNKHEHFKEICEYSVKNHIIPNYTTSGLELTDEEIEITRNNCGAVAVSFYDKKKDGYTYSAISRFMAAGITTNIHYVLSNNSIDDAIYRLETGDFPKGINAVIFLLHKPIGLGTKSNMLVPNDPRIKEFFSLIDNKKQHFQIGFDSCTIPGIINYTKNIDKVSIDSCEGGRYSMYIDSKMIALPCSFDNQDLKWGVDLKKNTIQESWNSNMFENFRSHFKTSCVCCPERGECKGGCPIVPEIVLCNRKEKDNLND